MSSVNSRVTRFRKVASQSMLVPPPLPLINLPEESRFARTGLPDERPMNLPVRRHIPNSVAVAALQVKTGLTITEFDGLQPSKPEPILQESQTLLDCQAEEYEELQVLARLHVYEYNQPTVCRDSDAPSDTLIFDSLFESGNLQRAERIYRKTSSTTCTSRKPQQEYELVIHPDVKNGAYRQWFYFEVRNGKLGVTYRFMLVNLAKSGALFGQGLQPVVYSEHAATKGVGWRHRGTHVRYDVAVSPLAPPGANALTFQYEFEHDNDCVFFACIQPYTYTDLMDYLNQLEHDSVRSQTLRRTELCQSLAGNSCELLSITSSSKDGIPHDERRIIVLSARVHPGEPNSSWMMQGMLDYLTGSSSGAVILRQNFIFKVVPMLNPDGVINGNTRVNLAGWDLNRKWSNPIEQLFPTIYHLKQQLAHFQSRGRVAIYCDLHGHSINRNIFTYGCYASKKKYGSSDGAKASAANTSLNINAGVHTDPRVFPMIVARHAPSFSFANCDFSVHKSKVTTARVVVNQELGVTNSYTLEASFCGPDFGVRKDTQFSTWDLEEMGRGWCQSLIVYYGLTAQVKALDAERAKQTSLNEQQSNLEVFSSTGSQTTQARTVETLLQEVEDEESRSARDLLLDCEAAISALFAHAGTATNGLEGFDDDHDSITLDSDLSGAEEEPIPPSVEAERHQLSPRSHRERKKQRDDEIEPIDGREGESSARGDSPMRKPLTSSSRSRKKAARRKHTRGNTSSKSKSALGQASRKSNNKCKKKKRKGKPDGRRTYSTTATPPLGPKSEDATTFPPDCEELSLTGTETTPKPLPPTIMRARRTKIKSARPRSSSEAPKSVSSAILQATTNGVRLGPMPTYRDSPSATLVVLPSVLDNNRSSGVIPRLLRTAPAYDQDFSGDNEEKNPFNLARPRSELPTLQLSSRDDEQRRRLSVRRKSRRQENDAIQFNNNSDTNPGRSKPESYSSSKLLDLVSRITN